MFKLNPLPGGAAHLEAVISVHFSFQILMPTSLRAKAWLLDAFTRCGCISVYKFMLVEININHNLINFSMDFCTL